MWDELMRTHHHLGFERLIGESMKHIAPNEPPIRRTLQSSDANALDRIASDWLRAQTEGRVFAVDGKTLRGSGSADRKPVRSMAPLRSARSALWSRTARSIRRPTKSPPSGPCLTLWTQKEPRSPHTQCTLRPSMPVTWRKRKRLTTRSPSNATSQPCSMVSQPSTTAIFPPPLIERERGHGRARIRFIRTSTRLRDHVNSPHVRQAFGIHRVRADHSGRIKSSQTV